MSRKDIILPRDRDVLVLEVVEGGLDLGGMVRLVEADYGEGVAALGLELYELFAADSRLLGELALYRRLVELFARKLGTLILGHVTTPWFWCWAPL